MLDQLRAQITQVSELMSVSTMNGQRQTLATALTDASTLAGWVALDRNSLAQAWEHHEVAKAAARETGSPSQLAHATAQQAFVLVELGETQAAVHQTASVPDSARHEVAPLLRSWLAAAHGEALAAAGQRDNALRAFDEADFLLPSDANDPALPFLFLAGSHLERWRRNALSKLGDPDAIDRLTSALTLLPDDFVRVRAVMHVDLAYAHADRNTARSTPVRLAAWRTWSDRLLRRLSRLVLPT